MNYHEILKAIVFCFIIFIFVGFFWIFTQLFSNNLEQFFLWKVASNNQSLLASIGNGASNMMQATSLENFLPIRKWQVEDLNVDAKAALSAQINTNTSREKILFEKNKDEKLPIASLTKLMTAAVSLDNYDFSQNIKINKTAEAQKGFFSAGETFSAETLLYAMLIGSDNTAAYALSEQMGEEKFVGLMNAKAKEFGLSNMYYSDPVGVGSNNYSTAEDLAKLTEQLLQKYPLIFKITSNQQFDIYDVNGKFHHKVVSTNQLFIDSAVSWTDKIIGSKTGTNIEAGECLVLILKSPNNDGYLINIILNSKDRFSEAKKMINWIYSAYEWRT